MIFKVAEAENEGRFFTEIQHSDDAISHIEDESLNLDFSLELYGAHNLMSGAFFIVERIEDM